MLSVFVDFHPHWLLDFFKILRASSDSILEKKCKFNFWLSICWLFYGALFRQLRNLEKAFGGDVRVCDRTALILDIFNQRAATREASLQVSSLLFFGIASWKYLHFCITSWILSGIIGTNGIPITTANPYVDSPWASSWRTGQGYGWKTNWSRQENFTYSGKQFLLWS